MDQHALAIYNLSADIAAVLAKNLIQEYPITNSALGKNEASENAVAGHFQCCLLYSALEKIQINRQADEERWGSLHQSLDQMILQQAKASADKVLEPLGQLADSEQLARVKKLVYQPLAAYEGTSLLKLEQGLEDTPVAILVTNLIKSFYAEPKTAPPPNQEAPKPDHSQLADRAINLSLEGIKELFNKGGLA
jgi:hypothetical protein